MEPLLAVDATMTTTLYLDFSNCTYIALLHCGRCVMRLESVSLFDDMNYGKAMPMTSTGIKGLATRIHSKSGCSINPPFLMGTISEN